MYTQKIWGDLSKKILEPTFDFSMATEQRIDIEKLIALYVIAIHDMKIEFKNLLLATASKY